MKKIGILICILILSSILVLAEGPQGINEPNTGLENPELKEANQETGQKLQEKVQNTEELKEVVQQRKQEMEQEMLGIRGSIQGVYQNQNRVRLVVSSLLAMKDLVSGIGPQVSTIAEEFDNSVKKTIMAEEKIQKRNIFVKWLAGGDTNSAEEITQEVNKNRERIRNLNQLRIQCNCNEELKTLMEEQTLNLEQEQNRLEELAQNEKENKGLFGWIWR